MSEMQHVHKHVHLMKFKPEELIFDEDETKDVLTFFYPNHGAFIGQAIINDDVRGFAQAIMVEAVDASYALGYVKTVFDVFYMKPPTKFGNALTKFGKKAAPHWFKHATTTDLTNAKLYDSVTGQYCQKFPFSL
jgi:hypothetical protein